MARNGTYSGIAYAIVTFSMTAFVPLASASSYCASPAATSVSGNFSAEASTAAQAWRSGNFLRAKQPQPAPQPQSHASGGGWSFGDFAKGATRMFSTLAYGAGLERMANGTATAQQTSLMQSGMLENMMVYGSPSAPPPPAATAAPVGGPMAPAPLMGSGSGSTIPSGAATGYPVRTSGTVGHYHLASCSESGLGNQINQITARGKKLMAGRGGATISRVTADVLGESINLYGEYVDKCHPSSAKRRAYLNAINSLSVSRAGALRTLAAVTP